MKKYLSPCCTAHVHRACLALARGNQEQLYLFGFARRSVHVMSCDVEPVDPSSSCMDHRGPETRSTEHIDTHAREKTRLAHGLLRPIRLYAAYPPSSLCYRISAHTSNKSRERKADRVVKPYSLLAEVSLSRPVHTARAAAITRESLAREGQAGWPMFCSFHYAVVCGLRCAAAAVCAGVCS